MLSLAHRCTADINPSPTSTLALLARCFSLTNRRTEASSAPSDVKPVNDDNPYKDSNKAFKLRFANDPDYRAKIAAQGRARYHDRCAKDPEYLAKLSARSVAWRQARIAIDPEFRAKENTRTKATIRARYRSQDQFRDAFRARSAQWWTEIDPATRQNVRQRLMLAGRQRYANNFTCRQRVGLQRWLRRKLPSRELEWRTHDAVIHADSVTHVCSGQHCGFEKKLKLWMKRKGSGPALYDCFKCFTSEWVPDKVLLIGYDHVVFGSGEKIVPTDSLGVEASRDAKSPNTVGHAASAKTP
jgi:hypothetical protein